MNSYYDSISFQMSEGRVRNDIPACPSPCVINVFMFMLIMGPPRFQPLNITSHDVTMVHTACRHIDTTFHCVILWTRHPETLVTGPVVVCFIPTSARVTPSAC